MTRLRLYSPPPTYGHCVAGTAITGSREDRVTGRKQCGAYACPHNLLVTHADDMPGRRFAVAAPEWSFDGESGKAGGPSCALDVASTGPKRCKDLEALLGRRTRRWQQEVHAALLRWRDKCVAAGMSEEEVARDIGALLRQLESERVQ